MKDAIVTVVGFLVLAAAVMSPVACTMNRHALMAEAIRGGADPIAVKCAIEADMGMSPMCVVKASRP
ncbi:hypothetical protein [Pantoea sp. 18069]|uniref:hypothetical protein n=1 Tax=Pantoea sp. 18069 TaxID=2681415 RepID=UPI0013583459|nr:hypothetical protein [Pantoea sp. 18069]